MCVTLSIYMFSFCSSVHPSVACPSVHPSIIHPSLLTAISPRRHSKHVQCPLRWWGSGHSALADARNGIKVKLNQRSWLSWNHIFASILKCVPMDKPDGIQPHQFRLFSKLFITPAVGRVRGHIVFGFCVLAYSRTYGRT